MQNNGVKLLKTHCYTSLSIQKPKTWCILR